MKEGDVITLDYIGRIKESGELFDTTKREVAEEEDAVNERAKYEPVKIIVGAEMVVEGLDEKLKKLEVGDKEEVEVPPEKAFGERKGDLIKTFSENKFKDQEMNPYPGMRVTIDQQVGRVLSVNSGRVRVDMNHPLAGRTLNYDLEIKEKIEGDEEKVKAVGGYYLGEEPDVEIDDAEATIEVPEEANERILEEIKEKVEEFLEVKNVSFKEVEKDENEGEVEESQ
ncbi:MAG: peptidylprolyl isomerase [Candidatus Aenigmatarchaeota archaeon]